MDVGLFYSNESKSELIGYADAGYLSDPHKADHKQVICLHVETRQYLGDQ